MWQRLSRVCCTGGGALGFLGSLLVHLWVPLRPLQRGQLDLPRSGSACMGMTELTAGVPLSPCVRLYVRLVML